MLSEEKMLAEWYSITGEVGLPILPAKIIKYVSAIEAAVLAEQAKQNPVAYLIEDSNGDGKAIRAKDVDKASLQRLIAVKVSPLYIHPAPAPEGMVMVPREPTETMLHEGLKAGLDVGFSVTTTVRQEIYRAMIAASEKEAGK